MATKHDGFDRTPLKRRILRRLPGALRSRAFRVILFAERIFSLFRPRRFAFTDNVLECVVSSNRYGVYCVPKSSKHRPAAQKILAHNVYEPDTIRFMTERCGDGDIVHAGTYFGDFLPALSQATAEGARIWAFEPVPENYRCARITLELNNIRNVELRHAGLGAEHGQSIVQTTDVAGRPLGGASRIVEDLDAAPGSLEVEIVRVDDVVPGDRRISIIQLDVEGYEKQALTGALESIRRWLPVLVLEVLPSSSLYTSLWFAESVLALGYRRTMDIHGNQVYEPTGVSDKRD